MVRAAKEAVGTVRISLVSRRGEDAFELPRVPSDGEAADFAAMWIQNHAVLFGTGKVTVHAEQPFVERIRRSFDLRFNQARPGKGWRSESVSDYLSVYNGAPFEIDSPAEPRNCPEPRSGSEGGPLRLPQKLEEAAETYFGCDVGGTSIKAVLLVRGQEFLSEALTQVQVDGYSSGTVIATILGLMDELCARAGVLPKDLACIGISWAGAVSGERNLIVGSSNILRSMCDFRDRDCERIAAFPELLLALLGAQNRRVPTFIINDGNVRAFDEVWTSGQLGTAVCILGRSLAGALVDGTGDFDLLAEFGRVVIDASPRALPHEFTEIRGVAGEYVGAKALLRHAKAAELDASGGGPLTKENVGRELNKELASPGHPDQGAVRSAVTDMCRDLAHFILTLRLFVPTVQQVLLGGGPVAPSCPLGQLIVEQTRSSLLTLTPDDQIGVEFTKASDQHAGARAAARYALSLWQALGRPADHPLPPFRAKLWA